MRHNLKQTLSTFARDLPQNIEVEKVVLGAILLEKDSLAEVIDILKVHVFYSDAHDNCKREPMTSVVG